jgi:hypothetical protein
MKASDLSASGGLVQNSGINLIEGSGYFFHDKMPGCCLPSLTAATALHFTAGYLKLSLQQDAVFCLLRRQ